LHGIIIYKLFSFYYVVYNQLLQGDPINVLRIIRIILQHWIRVMLKINIEPNKMETIIKPICNFQRSKLHEMVKKNNDRIFLSI